MTALLLMGALLPPVATGLGLSSWLRPGRSVCRLEVFGLSVLLGSLFISLFVFAAGYLVSGAAVGIAVWAVSLALGVLGLLRWRARGVQPSPHGLVAAILGVGALVAWQAMLLPIGGDGLFNFEVRAQLAYLNGGRIPPEFFSDVSRVWMHPEYPLFVPMSELAHYACAFGANQVAVKMLGGLWFAGITALGGAALLRASGEQWRAWVFLGLLAVTPAVVFEPGGAAWMWGDFPLGCFAVGAALYLLEYRSHGTGAGAFSLLTMALPWVKREGAIIAGILILGFVVVAARKRAWRDAAIATLPTALLFVGWRCFLAWVEPAPSADYAPFSIATIVDRMDRVGLIATVLLRELAVMLRWSLLWLLALAAAIRVARTAPLAHWVPLVPVLFGIVAVECGPYLLSNWPDVLNHIVFSLPRLLLPPAMLAIVLISAGIPKLQIGGTPALDRT